jgi:hypothetical protein
VLLNKLAGEKERLLIKNAEIDGCLETKHPALSESITGISPLLLV